MDTEKILHYIGNITENLEGILNTVEGYGELPEGAIFVDKEQKVNFISVKEALRILEGFGEDSSSVILGKSDYILIYDATKKLKIDGEEYILAGYLVMKAFHGFKPLDEEEMEEALSLLEERVAELALGRYRVQAFKF